MTTYNVYYKEGRDTKVWCVKAFDELDAKDRFAKCHSKRCTVTDVEEIR